MTLREFCERITRCDPNMLPEDSRLGQRIMRPEYSLSCENTKTFPENVELSARLFALCWNITPEHRLYGSIKPWEPSFCLSCGFEPGDRTQLHTHDYLELSYVVSGRFRQRIMDRDIVFEQGELCLIDKNCLHQDYLDDGSAVVLFLGISNEFFEDIMENRAASDRILNFLQSALLKQKNLLQYLHFKPQANAAERGATQGRSGIQDHLPGRQPDVVGAAQADAEREHLAGMQAGTPRLERCLLRLLEELCAVDAFSPLICRGLLMRVFHILSTDYDFSLSRELRREMNWLIYEEITDYIRAHCADVSIRELCGRFHFQEDYFNRLLKQKTGQTYTEYVQGLRLAEAERLLTETELSIEQVAAQVGYQNKGYFYRIFAERCGATPAQYRRSRRG